MYKSLRDSVATVEDVNLLFRDKIMPVCFSYGREYVAAAVVLQKAYQEALNVLPEKNINAFRSYLLASDLYSQESEAEKPLVLTTVHKAKGKEFDNVIYIPSKGNNRSDFKDRVIEAILISKGFCAGEELEEESLRVNFVAFTRAVNSLVILTDKVQEYLSDFSELKEIAAGQESNVELNEGRKRAFDLFVNGDFDSAKKLLISKDEWIRDFIKDYFASLPHISFSRLPNNAYDYFVDEMLKIRDFNAAANTGSEVHDFAQKIALGKEVSFRDELKPYVENVRRLLEEIQLKYPETAETEQKIYIPLRSLGFDSNLHLKGYIDAVFKNNDEYLIVDWKTDRKTDKSSKHRQQLETYKRAFAQVHGVDVRKIRVAIGYVGLRTTINTGKVECSLDTKQPSSSSFDTFSKRVNKLLAWINNPNTFIQDFITEKVDSTIWRSVVEGVGKN